MTQQLATIERIKSVMPAEAKFNASNPFEMNFKQEYGFAVMAVQSNPYLLNCTPQSIQSSIISVALTGISLNPALKYAYLVPRKVKNELRCSLDISYIGMIKILTDAGAVKSVDAAVVYENDQFKFSKGSSPFVEHVPEIFGDRGKMMGAYAVAHFRDSGFQFEIMTREEIERVRSTSESWKNEKTRQYSPWENWTDEMWKKTVMKRLFKVLPKTDFTDQLIAALGKDHQNDIEDSAENQERIETIFEDVEPGDNNAANPEQTIIEAKDTSLFDKKMDGK